MQATASLFRRGYHSTQSVKLSPWATRLVPHKTSIAKYAETGRDDLNLERHFRHWISNPLGYPTLMVDYDQIWDNLDSVFRFLEIPSNEIDTFPKRKPRKSSLSAIDPIVLSKLEAIYKDFRRTLAEIGPVHELIPNRKYGTFQSLPTVNAAMVPYHTTIHYLKSFLAGTKKFKTSEPLQE